MILLRNIPRYYIRDEVFINIKYEYTHLMVAPTDISRGLLFSNSLVTSYNTIQTQRGENSVTTIACELIIEDDKEYDNRTILCTALAILIIRDAHSREI